MRFINFIFIFGLFPILSVAQTPIPDIDVLGRNNAQITTAVPFLTISPDARSGALADAGVATTADANSIYWNPGKMAFIENSDGEPSDIGVSLSYTPWLRRLINDMSLNYLSGYKRLSDVEVIGLSLNYFNLGSMTFRDDEGNILNDNVRPREFAFNFAYSRKLSDNLGVGIGVKYVHSNLTQGAVTLSNGTTARPGNTAAADIGVYYNKAFTELARKAGLIDGNLALGASISNLGAKISYSDNGVSNFIPANLRLGFAATADIDPYNSITFIVDVNKLLVPTPPITALDSAGNVVIIDGQDPDRGFISGVFGSFTDAPGGFAEEIREFTASIAAEYWYAKALAVRAGYFTESELKGNRKYFTLGLGVKYKKYGFDFAYLVPVQQNNSLQDTLRFTLSLSK